MDLQALYDLKERLEHAAVAGTGLLQEDFRLKRAVEALAPLAAASPVFGKITAAAQALLAAPAEDRGTRLLDVLALVDAVAYTQGVVDVPGELTPLEGGGGAFVQASYGMLHPLLTALTTTGGGRMEVVQSTFENHPEFFGDFRVLPALIADLGDSYGELAELNAKILKKTGPAALPLLKGDFDPAGKKEMVRRRREDNVRSHAGRQALGGGEHGNLRYIYGQEGWPRFCGGAADGYPAGVPAQHQFCPSAGILPGSF